MNIEVDILEVRKKLLEKLFGEKEKVEWVVKGVELFFEHICAAANQSNHKSDGTQEGTQPPSVEAENPDTGPASS